MGIIDLDSEGFSMREGIYSVSDGEEIIEIDVYKNRRGVLCCFKDDYGNGGTNCDCEVPDHVRIDKTGLEFIKRIGDLGLER